MDGLVAPYQEMPQKYRGGQTLCSQVWNSPSELAQCFIWLNTLRIPGAFSLCKTLLPLILVTSEQRCTVEEQLHGLE